MFRYKKITVFIIIIVIICGAYATKTYCDNRYDENLNSYVRYQYSKNNSIKMKVTIVSAMTSYSHLGEDLSYTHTYNGLPIKSGDIVTIYGSAKFTTKITEADSIPDTNSGSLTFSMPSDCAGAFKTISIRVDEKGGRRYAGAYATWDVTYTLAPIIDDHWDVVFYGLSGNYKQLVQITIISIIAAFSILLVIRKLKKRHINKQKIAVIPDENLSN